MVTGITTRLLLRQLRGDSCLYVVLAKIGTTTLVVLWFGHVWVFWYQMCSWLLQHSANSVLDFGNNWSSSQRRLHYFEHVGVHVRFLVIATVPEVALDMSVCLQHSWFHSGDTVPVQIRRNSTGAVLGSCCCARFVQRRGSDSAKTVWRSRRCSSVW